MNFGTQRACAWAGLVSIVIFLTGISVAKLSPPTPPIWNAAQVADFYVQNAHSVLTGTILMMIGESLLIPFFCLIAAQMKRIEGEVAPLTYSFIMGATIGLVPPFTGMTLWATAAFRPERAPEITQMLSDFAWIGIIFVVTPPMIMLLALGIAVLNDRNKVAIFPKWIGYISLLCALLSGAGLDIINHKDGLFAWNGALGYYLSASIFAGVWILAMVWQLLKTISRSEKAYVAAPGH